MHFKRIAALSLMLGLFVPHQLTAQQTAVMELSLRPGDVLQIGVWPNAELGGQFVVQNQGVVYLPFLGETHVTGMSVTQLREELMRGYSVAMQNPILTVTPLFRIGVMGAVNRPGIYLTPSTDMLFDVIGSAGGFAEQADTKDVKIVRDGQIVKLDTQRALETGDLLPLQALQLRSGDILMVGSRSPITVGAVLAGINVILATVLLVDRITRD